MQQSLDKIKNNNKIYLMLASKFSNRMIFKIGQLNVLILFLMLSTYKDELLPVLCWINFVLLMKEKNKIKSKHVIT